MNINTQNMFINELEIPDKVIDSFKLKKNLNGKFWRGFSLNSVVRRKLINIVSAFIRELDLDGIKVKDIVITGSLCNYNWSEYSDLDIHIIIDNNSYSCDVEILENLFRQYKTVWNEKYDIKIFNFPVELYMEFNRDFIEGSGIYSVINNKWILKPTNTKFTINKKLVLKKVNKFVGIVNHISDLCDNKEYDSALTKIDKLKDFLRKYRKSGLEDGGEFSSENIVFKTLRRGGIIEYINKLKIEIYSNKLSINESQNIPKVQKGHLVLIKGKPLEGNECRLYVGRVKSYSKLDRKTTDNEAGQPADMVYFYDEFYRIGFDENKLIPNKVLWGSEDNKKKALNMQNNALALNNNKTPLHDKTLKYNDINKMLYELKGQIINIPNIKWVN